MVLLLSKVMLVCCVNVLLMRKLWFLVMKYIGMLFLFMFCVVVVMWLGSLVLLLLLIYVFTRLLRMYSVLVVCICVLVSRCLNKVVICG